MACYLLKPQQDGVEQVWKQPYESNGANIASEGSAYSGGGLAWGSGTTPTLSKKLVFFTDNADPISLIALDIASGNQVVKIPLFEGIGKDTPVSVDNSIIVYGRDENTCLVVAGNTFGLWSKGVCTDPEKGDIQLGGGTMIDASFIQNGNLALSPGMDCVEIKKESNDEYKARILWHRDDMRNSSVSRLSAPSGRLFLYNQNLDTSFWQFEVLDVQTGQTLYTVPISDSPGSNNCGAIVQIDPCGYQVSIPTADKHLWSAWDDFISLENSQNALLNNVTRSVPNHDASSVGYSYTCSVNDENAVLLIEITDIAADVRNLKLCAKTADGSVTLDDDLYSLLDQSSGTVVDGKLNAAKTYTLRLSVQDGQPFDLDLNSGNIRVEVYFTTR